MIYLLATLWFASGFFGGVYATITFDGRDFKIPSDYFFLSLLMGVFAPAMWLILIVSWCESSSYPQITLFKARKK